MCSRSDSCRWRKTSTTLLAEAEDAMFKGIKTSTERSFVEISNGNRIRTVKVGTTIDHYHRIPIVLLHGFAAGCAFWALNFDELSAKQNVYAIDILGFGLSSRPVFPTDHLEAEELFIDSIEEWRKEVGLSRFILVGHSFGGFLAASYSIKYRNRVQHLILADPWGFPVKPKPGEEPIEIPLFFKGIASVLTAFNPLAILRALGPLGPSVARGLRADLRNKFERLYGEGDARIMDYIYHCNAQKPSGETAFMTMTFTTPLPYSKNPLIQRIDKFDSSVPITLVYGSNSWVEILSDFNQLKLYRETIEIHELKDCGHHVYADRCEEFNDIIINNTYIQETRLTMVNITGPLLARRQTIIYGVKRGKIPAALRPRVLPQRKDLGNPTCLDEISKLFNCWNASAFKDSVCDGEIKAFLSCANESLDSYHKSGKGKKTEWNTEKLSALVGQYTKVEKRGMREKKVFLNQIIK